ncbi:hypothetical protein HOU00_gp214 [Caulobacter phage CcrPW]|uniref:Uncharacterized protein n=1 Tax=Caulobacter phage CcrPW TaxID=2283271 RepID=A0A385EAJ9_9CAUD|nr:hypothetical protein HOU00_gp214 [Caulobacter phage CcrPW]AXQ68911.1 hypothetical protein CcrPW_gp372c [Caulobacter phage CcrPW]
MSRGFIHLQGDRKPVVIPGLGSFLVSVNGSTMATDHVLVEFWAEGRDAPAMGHVGYKPRIAATGGLTFGKPYNYNLRIGAGERDWSKAAYDQALVLAEAVQVHDATGTLWVLKSLCHIGWLDHRDRLQQAEHTVENFTAMLADPLYPQTERYRNRETGEYVDEPVSEEERARRRAGWPAVLERAQNTVRELTSIEALRQQRRIELTRQLLKTLYFDAPKRKMSPREIAQAALNMLEGVE